MTETEKFEQFHAANPGVYNHLLSLARDFKKRVPGQKLGFRMLWEVMRWNNFMRVRREDEESYKFNDHYCPRYARMLMAENPELEGLFELRAIKKP